VALFRNLSKDLFLGVISGGAVELQSAGIGANFAM
jgi:hypothetical protein